MTTNIVVMPRKQLICEEQMMKIHPKNNSCKGNSRTIPKNVIKFMYPSLSQELFDTLSPNLKVCAKTYLDCTQKQKNIMH